MKNVVFSELTLEEKVKYLISNREMFEKYQNEILQLPELQKLLLLESEDFFLFFNYVPTEVQNAMIFGNLDLIKNFSDIKLERLIAGINSLETQNYCINYFNYIDFLRLLDANNIFYSLSTIKDQNIVLQFINDDIIFEKMMTKVNFRNSGFYMYNCENFEYLSDKFQILIIDKAKQLKYDEQVNELLEQVNDDVKIKYFSGSIANLEQLVDYLIITRDEDKKAQLFEMISSSNFIKELVVIKLFDLIPDYLNEDDLNRVFNLVDVKSLVSAGLKAKDKFQYFSSLLKDKILSVSLDSFFDASGVVRLFKDDPELYALLDRFNSEQICKDINETVVDYMLYKVSINPNYFKGVVYQRILNSRIRVAKDKLELLYSYLEPEFAISLLNADSTEFILEKVRKNPKLINFIRDSKVLEYLFLNAIELFEYIDPVVIFRNMSSISKELSSYLFIKIKKDNIVLPNNSFNFDFSFSKFFNFLKDIDKCEMIDNHLDFNLVVKLLTLDTGLEEYIKNKIVDRQNEFLTHSSYSVYKLAFSLSKDKFFDYISKFNDAVLLDAFVNFSSPNMLVELMRRYENNKYIFSENANGDLCFESLPKDKRDFIYSQMQQDLKVLEIIDKDLYHKVIINNTINNYNIVKLIENGQIKDLQVLNTLKHLLNKNPFVIMSLNIEMLTPEIMNLDLKFLEKISRYEDLQNRLINLRDSNYNNYINFINICNMISEDNIKVFDQKILYLLDYFENNIVSFNHELSDLEINSLINYILMNSNVFSLKNYKSFSQGIDPLNYQRELSERCDLKFSTSVSLVEIKDLYFKKYYNLSYDEVKEFLMLYDNDSKNILDDRCRQLLNIFNAIMVLNDIEEMKQIYINQIGDCNLSDILDIEALIQRTYTDDILDNLFTNVESNDVIMIDGEEVSVVNVGLEFNMIVHSTNAYSKMPMIDNNYYDSWNLSKNTINHGICTCLVSSKCLGFPPLNVNDKEDGVIFGFSSFSIDSINSMAPYDLFSVNSGYITDTERRACFTTLEGCISSTRHTHNEFVIERNNLLDSKTNNIQPTCVIILSTMEEYQKKNARKAASEMNPPEGIPIVYVDVEKIVLSSKEMIESKIELFRSTGDLKLLSEIINDYETMKCSLSRSWNFPYVDVNVINQVISDYIVKVSMSSDKESKLIELEEILNYEKSKFDLSVDAGNRRRYFDLDYLNHIRNIYTNLGDVKFSEFDQTEFVEKSNIYISGGLCKDTGYSLAGISLVIDKVAPFLNLKDVDKYLLMNCFYDDNLVASDLKIFVDFIKKASLLSSDVEIDNLLSTYNVDLSNYNVIYILSVYKDLNNLLNGFDPNKLINGSIKVIVNYSLELMNYIKELNNKDILDVDEDTVNL